MTRFSILLLWWAWCGLWCCTWFGIVEAFSITSHSYERPVSLSLSAISSSTTLMDNNSIPKVTPSDDNNNNDGDGDRSSSPYDLVVVGGGVVGVQSALAAANLNKRVCLIDAPEASGALMADAEDDDRTMVTSSSSSSSPSPQHKQKEDLSLGGPTGLFGKALRDTSKRIKVQTLRGLGLREESVWNEIISMCLDLARSNAQDIRRQLNMAGVEYVQGYASFPKLSSQDTTRLEVTASRMNTPQERVDDNDNEDATTTITQEHTTVRAAKILLATGSQPFRPSDIPFDGQRIHDSDSINSLSYLPKSIAITGSGIIAIEFAKIFRNLGAEVTLIIRDQVPRKALEKIGLDSDIAATLVADIVRCGIKVERGAQVGGFLVPANPRSPITIQLRAKGGAPRKDGLRSEVKCDCYLAAVGRKPNTQNLNLEAAGIQTDEYGGLLVDSSLCTTAPLGNVFAAGDVLGRPFLASTGTAQGRAAVTAMFASVDDNDTDVSSSKTIASPSCDPDDPSCVVDGIAQAGTSFDPASLASNPFAFPTGIWSSPEAAYFGLSKPQATAMGIDAGEGMALYAECLRGRVFSPNGLLKLVFEKPAGRILGVHICGDDACELIHYGMELVKGRRTVDDLNNTLYSAVTFHEMYKIAAQNALDEAGARKRRAAAGKAVAARQRAARAVEQ